jgi:hypothetical protein
MKGFRIDEANCTQFVILKEQAISGLQAVVIAVMVSREYGDAESKRLFTFGGVKRST